MTGRARGPVGDPATKRTLLPPALHRRLGEDDVLVDAPLTGRPPEYVNRGASEVAVDPPGQLLRPAAIRSEELRADLTAFPAVVRLVGGPVLGLRRGADELGAMCTARQLRAGRQSVKVDTGLPETPTRGRLSRRSASGRPRDDKHERYDDPAETAVCRCSPMAHQRHYNCPTWGACSASWRVSRRKPGSRPAERGAR